MEHAQKRKYSYRDLLVVIVLYQTELEHSASFVSLTKANRSQNPVDVIVYDNTPNVNREATSFLKAGFQIQYIHDPTNPGVSKAYNTAIDIAGEKEKKWILFLDQDTRISGNMLDLFLNAINTQPQFKVFATTLYDAEGLLISPSLYAFKRGFRLKRTPENRCSLRRIRPINSLLLLSLEVFEKVGRYNENIKLDFSDHEFMGRVQKVYKEMYVIKEENYHSLSSSDDTNLSAIETRFKFFCNGARAAGRQSTWDSIQYFMVCLLRAIRLAVRHRSTKFLKILTRAWMLQN